MNEFVNIAWLRELPQQALTWLEANVLVTGNLLQLIYLLVALVAARALARPLHRGVRRLADGRLGRAGLGPVLRALGKVSLPLAWLVVLWLAVAVSMQADWPHHLLQVAASLLNAWVVIRLASRLIRSPGWSSFIAALAWTLAALSTLGLFEATTAFLDGLAIRFGDVRISALAVIKGVVALSVLLWVAITASNVFEARISRAPNLTPSLQVLLGKLTKIVLVTMAFVIALDAVGIDLTAFAVFGGALGVGIGFGLQKIVSNLVSGLILLIDKSIKPGDVISLGDTYGWIVSLGARYAAVHTRDGIDHLIPNEELITQRVENWSHTDRRVRLKMPIGVSYGADLRLAIRLCLEAAATAPRVLKDPRPACLLRGFGDSSVDLELRIWVSDPQNGRSNVISEVLLAVWDRFREHEVEIPFPQRDLHLRTSEVALFPAANGAGDRASSGDDTPALGAAPGTAHGDAQAAGAGAAAGVAGAGGARPASD